MSTQAPEAPVTEAPTAETPAAAPVAEAPRVPAGEPGAGQFQPQQPAPPAAAATPPAAEPAAPPKPAAPPEPDWKAEAAKLKAEGEKVKAEAERWKQQSRAQEARSKANHAQLKNSDALLREVAAKVGIEFDDKPDPEELTRKLDAAQAAATQKTVELAVYTTAADAGANAKALLDSREFMAKTAQLDPEAADFPSQVAELVAAAAEQPRYAAPVAAAPAPLSHQPSDNFQQPPAPAAPPAPASGADFSGAPGGNRLWTQADYDHWSNPVNDRDGKIVTKAIQDGLLVNLGIGKPKTRNRR